MRSLGHSSHPFMPWPARLLGSARLAAGLAVQARCAFRSPEAIQRAQSRRLSATMTHAFRSVPYYRETMRGLGLTPADFRTAADLVRLPVLERSDLQRDPERFRSDAYATNDLLELRSSGRTGEPVVVWHDLGAVIANAAHGERDRSIWAGTLVPRAGYREAVIGVEQGSDASVQRFLRRGVALPARADIERRYLSPYEPVAATVAALNAFRPHVVHGYGSMMDLMLAHVAATGAEFVRPSVVTTSSDELGVATRAHLERDLGVPVFSTYEAIEAFKIGFQCERRDGYHLNVDLYPLRIDPGGEVIVSNLVNRATVLLNYRIGDYATLSPEPCPCGRGLPLLASLDGRRDDAFVRADGSRVLPMTLTIAFTRTPGVRQFQLEEVERLRFVARIVAAPECDRPVAAEHAETTIRRVIGAEARVRVDYADRIEPGPGGKVRRFVALGG